MTSAPTRAVRGVRHSGRRTTEQIGERDLELTLQTCKCQVAHHPGLHGIFPLDSPTESHRRCKSGLISALPMPPSHRRALNTAACTADALHMEAFCSSYSSGRSTSSVRRGLNGEPPLHTCAGLQPCSGSREIDGWKFQCRFGGVDSRLPTLSLQLQGLWLPMTADSYLGSCEARVFR